MDQLGRIRDHLLGPLLLKSQPWLLVVLVVVFQTQWPPDNNAANFPFAVISVLSQRSIDFNNFLVLLSKKVGPSHFLAPPIKKMHTPVGQ